MLTLAQAAGDTDGAYPLSEHVVLHLRHGGDAPAVHLLARDQDGVLAGYAHLDTTDEVEGASAEVVVHPLRRRRGLGRALVRTAMDVADKTDPRGRLRLWAHGDHPSAGALALGLGFVRDRVLLQMRRSLFAPLPESRLPDGVALRPFQPGADDEAWVALNARAFADHPDQGRWTLHDLRLRMAEPWFDPAGFLLAVDEASGRLLGFHWTKVHGDRGHHHEHQHEPIGEVYVLGIDPDAHGTGLGSALTAAGLRHLRGRGLDQAMLYVDESNVRAVALYTRLGFARWSTDVSYRRVVHPVTAASR
ncbi:mycothiol synthase [Phytohabitans flavus]|uniref:Mycothiol acetyltransferase n=1 Tax=Phytohabitans flavus TaxID=1076124 RepID=A0A6F8Y2J8_9ACTN|nr:mycothiol acetyltransferase [Phytohabitans flavus]